jgi:LysM repeat protein
LISIVLGAKAPAVRNDIVAGMINQYYAFVGEDQLAQAPVSPLSTTIFAGKEEEISDSGSVIYMTRVVRTLHTVYKGETLTTIADMYDCPLADLKKWNRLRTSTVKPGKKLIVYSKVRAKADSASLTRITIPKETILPTASAAAIAPKP